MVGEKNAQGSPQEEWGLPGHLKLRKQEEKKTLPLFSGYLYPGRKAADRWVPDAVKQQPVWAPDDGRIYSCGWLREPSGPGNCTQPGDAPCKTNEPRLRRTNR